MAGLVHFDVLVVFSLSHRRIVRAKLDSGRALRIWLRKDNHVTGFRVFVEPAASGTLDAG
jgi:hypothetical protein